MPVEGSYLIPRSMCSLMPKPGEEEEGVSDGGSRQGWGSERAPPLAKTNNNKERRGEAAEKETNPRTHNRADGRREAKNKKAEQARARRGAPKLPESLKFLRTSSNSFTFRPDSCLLSHSFRRQGRVR